jgi:hypothetical protein
MVLTTNFTSTRIKERFINIMNMVKRRIMVLALSISLVATIFIGILVGCQTDKPTSSSGASSLQSGTSSGVVSGGNASSISSAVSSAASGSTPNEPAPSSVRAFLLSGETGCIYSYGGDSLTFSYENGKVLSHFPQNLSSEIFNLNGKALGDGGLYVSLYKTAVVCLSNNILTVVYSDDLGKTWKQSQPITQKIIGQTVADDGSDDLSWIADTQVTFTSKTCGFLFVGSETAMNHQTNQIYLRTLDGGKTWVRQSGNTVGGQIVSDVAFENRNVGFSCAECFVDLGGAAIYKTTDGGVGWKRIDLDEQMPDNYISAFLFAPYKAGSKWVLPVYVQGTSLNKIIHLTSGDDGSTWTHNPSMDQNPNSVLPHTSDFQYWSIDNKITITNYIGSDVNVVIPSTINGQTVTNIGRSAFFSRNICSVTLPNTIESIDQDAFDACETLTHVNVPDSVKNIGDDAFVLCHSLTGISLPGSITHIGSCVFQDDKNLIYVNVDAKCLYYASKGGVLFDKHYKTIILYPENKPGDSYSIPDTVTNIADCAFWCSNNLSSVTIPNGTTYIGSQSFEGCKALTSITIPGSVTTIRDSAFPVCSNLTSVYFEGNAPKMGESVFLGESAGFTIFYHKGKSGWDASEMYKYPLVSW